MALKRFVRTELKAIALFLSWVFILPLSVVMLLWYFFSYISTSTIFEKEEHLSALKSSGKILFAALYMPFVKFLRGFAELIADFADTRTGPCGK